jgi:hypothetical protein
MILILHEEFSYHVEQLKCSNRREENDLMGHTLGMDLL